MAEKKSSTMAASSSSEKGASNSVSYDDPSSEWNSTKEPTASQKLWMKSKEAPFVPIGIAGTLGIVAYGFYSYKNRGPMSTSRYIMKFRVLAQSAVVGAMIIGAAFGVNAKK